jgi:hypothetical protein
MRRNWRGLRVEQGARAELESEMRGGNWGKMTC